MLRVGDFYGVSQDGWMVGNIKERKVMVKGKVKMVKRFKQMIYHRCKGCGKEWYYQISERYCPYCQSRGLFHLRYMIGFDLNKKD